MKTGYLGPAGTFTEQSLSIYNPSAERIALPTIRHVFEAVKQGDADSGYIPHENMIDGIVTQTLDNLVAFSDSVHIIGGHMLPIELAIGMHPKTTGHEYIEQVFSKDKALGQCSDYLCESLPLAECIPVGSTAGAMEKIMQEGLIGSAAIGRIDSLRTYGLEILDDNIANEKENRTRFYEIGPSYVGPAGKDITALCVYPRRDRQGILKDMLIQISDESGLNMTSIHSRPDRKGGNRFFIDVSGHFHQPEVAECVRELERKLPDTQVSVLGTHRHLPFREPLIRKIGLIGGNGVMGRYLGSFFKHRAEYDVLVHDMNTPLSLRACVEQSDAVMLSVPIDASDKVLKQVTPLLRPGQLLCDNIGVKTPLVEDMIHLTADGVEVASLHTMFGPDVEDMVGTVAGKNIITIPNKKHGTMAQELEDMIHRHGGNIHEASAEEHDTAVTITQSLEHVDNVVKAAVVRKIAGQDINLSAFDTPNSQKSRQVYERIHRSSPALLGMMLRSNPRAIQTLEEYASTFTSIVDDLKGGSSDVFEQLMKKGKR